MDSAEGINIEWNDFKKTTTQHFYSCVENSKYADVKLYAEGKFIMAHRIVLSAASFYFEDLFDAATEDQLVVAVPICYKDLINVVSYAYKGKLNVQPEDLERFILAAKVLQLKGISGPQSSELNGREAPREELNLMPIDKSQQDNKKIQLKGIPGLETSVLDKLEAPCEELNSMPIDKSQEDNMDIFEPVVQLGEPSIEENDIKPALPQLPVSRSKRTAKVLSSMPNSKSSKKVSFVEPPSSTKCEHCHKFISFTRKSVVRHEVDCQSNPNRTIHQCPICKKIFSRFDNLRAHMRSDHKLIYASL